MQCSAVEHIHHHRCSMYNNNSNWNVLKWSKGKRIDLNLVFCFQSVPLPCSETFQRVLTQIVEQSFSNVYDEFAREIGTTSSSDMQQWAREKSWISFQNQKGILSDQQPLSIPKYLWQKLFQWAIISTQNCQVITNNCWCISRFDVFLFQRISMIKFLFRVSHVDQNCMIIPNMHMIYFQMNLHNHQVVLLIHFYRRHQFHSIYHRFCTRGWLHIDTRSLFSSTTCVFFFFFFFFFFVWFTIKNNDKKYFCVCLRVFFHVGQRRRILNFSLFGTRLRMSRPS